MDGMARPELSAYVASASSTSSSVPRASAKCQMRCWTAVLTGSRPSLYGGKNSAGPVLWLVRSDRAALRWEEEKRATVTRSVTPNRTNAIATNTITDSA